MSILRGGRPSHIALMALGYVCFCCSCQKPPTDKSSGYHLVGIEDALLEYKSGTLFMDARRSRDYEAGHITEALSISPYEADMEEKIGRLKENPETIAEAPIVAYCTDANDCEDSKFLAQQLEAAGFPNVMVYTGGFWEWQEEHPDYVTKGKEPGKREA